MYHQWWTFNTSAPPSRSLWGWQQLQPLKQFKEHSCPVQTSVLAVSLGTKPSCVQVWLSQVGSQHWPSPPKNILQRANVLRSSTPTMYHQWWTFNTSAPPSRSLWGWQQPRPLKQFKEHACPVQTSVLAASLGTKPSCVQVWLSQVGTQHWPSPPKNILQRANVLLSSTPTMYHQWWTFNTSAPPSRSLWGWQQLRPLKQFKEHACPVQTSVLAVSLGTKPSCVQVWLSQVGTQHWPSPPKNILQRANVLPSSTPTMYHQWWTFNTSAPPSRSLWGWQQLRPLKQFKEHACPVQTSVLAASLGTKPSCVQVWLSQVGTQHWPSPPKNILQRANVLLSPTPTMYHQWWTFNTSAPPSRSLWGWQQPRPLKQFKEHACPVQTSVLAVSLGTKPSCVQVWLSQVGSQHWPSPPKNILQRANVLLSSTPTMYHQWWTFNTSAPPSRSLWGWQQLRPLNSSRSTLAQCKPRSWPSHWVRSHPVCKYDSRKWVRSIDHRHLRTSYKEQMSC